MVSFTLHTVIELVLMILIDTSDFYIFIFMSVWMIVIFILDHKLHKNAEASTSSSSTLIFTKKKLFKTDVK